MTLIRAAFVELCLLIACLRLSHGYHYQAKLLNEEVFDECSRPHYNSIESLFDLSELRFRMESDVVFVSGNTTLKWAVDIKDRIEATITFFYYERFAWQQRAYVFVLKDFCKYMYEKNRFWYEFWLQHVINVDEVRDKCLSVPGTKLIHRPFELKLDLNLGFSLRSGLYKLEMTFTPFNERNIRSSAPICFEIRAELETA
ncbi:hypothetical protein KR222_007506 [Zaprionus bogoriensis]|nr:hypothetical protein KR222_007506 [Zaprionus bogoriensis]